MIKWIKWEKLCTVILFVSSLEYFIIIFPHFCEFVHPWFYRTQSLGFSSAGNNVKKLLVDLANPRSVDPVHRVLTETNHKVSLEAVGAKPGIMNISSSAEIFHHFFGITY